MKKAEVFRKPDGTYTKSPTAMLKAWRGISRELGVITGTRLTGFDPTVSLRNEETGELVQLPVWFVSSIHEYFVANGLKGKVLSSAQAGERWTTKLRGLDSNQRLPR